MEENVQQELVKWFVKMGAESSIPLSNIEEDCKALCSPQMKDIWLHIIKHVKPINEVQHIKKVLLLDHLENNPQYAQKKLKVRVSTVEELEKLERREMLQSKLNNLNTEIFEKKTAMRKVLTSLSERTAELKDLNEKRRNKHRISGVLDLKKQTECEKLQQLVYFADQIKTSISSLNKAALLEKDANCDTYVNSCLEEFNSCIKNQFVSTGVTFYGVDKLRDNFLSASVPIKLMIYEIMERLESSSLNISKLTDSEDMRSLLNNARLVRTKYEKHFEEKIQNSKNDMVNRYLDNRKLEEDVKTDVIELKTLKNDLFIMLLQKSKSNHSADEVITKSDFDDWFESEIKCITLENMKKTIMDYKCGGISDISETKINATDVVLKQYRKEIDDSYQQISDLKTQIASCMQDWENVDMKHKLHQLHQDSIASNNSLRNLNFPKEIPESNIILKEYELIRSIPYNILTSNPDKESLCKFSSAEFAEIINICNWLWIVKHQDYLSMSNTQPSIDSGTIRNRIAELSAEKDEFMDWVQNFMTVLQEKVNNNEVQIEECKHLFEMRKYLPKFGEYIPDSMLYEGDNFSTWFDRFKEKIKNLSDDRSLK